MDGARSYARILLSLDDEQLAVAATDDDIGIVIAWLAGYRADKFVAKAIDRLLEAMSGTSH